MKKVTSVAGSLFLVWFFAAPIVGFTLFVRTHEYITPLIFVYLILSYVILGLLAYYIAQYSGGIFLKDEPAKPKTDTNIAINYVVYANILYFIGSFLVAALMGSLLSNIFFYIIVAVILIFLATYIAARFVKSKYHVSKGVVSKSLWFFAVGNLVFLLLLKYSIGQNFITVADVSFILGLIVFYITTKKYLVPNK